MIAKIWMYILYKLYNVYYSIHYAMCTIHIKKMHTENALKTLPAH